MSGVMGELQNAGDRSNGDIEMDLGESSQDVLVGCDDTVGDESALSIKHQENVMKKANQKDGKKVFNPASLGTAPKKTPHPRPGLTGTPTERASQQLLHNAIEFRDIHKACSYLPAALGSSPSNIPTLLWELLIWPPNYLPLERLLFSIKLVHAAANCLKSSLGPDCFEANHPFYGSWSSRAASDAHGNRKAKAKAHSDGIERIGRGSYVLLLEQVVYGLMRDGKWEASLRSARKMLDLDQGDDCGIRFSMPIGMLKLGMGLQCVKFCMGWLDELGDSGPAPAIPVHGAGRVSWAGQGAGGVVGGVDLGLDMVQGRYNRNAARWPRMPFLVALGCWYMFHDSGQISSTATQNKRNGGGNGNSTNLPVCKSARAWLRLGHKSNRYVLRILLTMITHKSTYMGPTGYLAGQPAAYPSVTPGEQNSSVSNFPDPTSYEEANDFIYSTHGLFLDEARQVQRWLLDTAHLWVINTCPQCNQKEGKVGEHKACLGCRGVWYCGVDCQKLNWGTHRAACRAVARTRKARELGKGLID